MSKETFKVIEHLQKAFPNQPVSVMREGEGEHARYIISMVHNHYIPLERNVLGNALGIENGKQHIQRCELPPEISYNIAVPPHILKTMRRAARGETWEFVDFKRALLHHIGDQGHLFIPGEDLKGANIRFTNAQGVSHLDEFDKHMNGDRILDRYTIDVTPVYEAIAPSPGADPGNITIKDREYAGIYTVKLTPKEKLINNQLTYERPLFEPAGVVKNFLKLDPEHVLVMDATIRSPIMFSVNARRVDIALDNLEAIPGPPPLPGERTSAKGPNRSGRS